jgi:hypothetical protein
MRETALGVIFGQAQERPTVLLGYLPVLSQSVLKMRLASARAVWGSCMGICAGRWFSEMANVACLTERRRECTRGGARRASQAPVPEMFRGSSAPDLNR